MEKEERSSRGLKQIARDFATELELLKKILGWWETWIPTLVAACWILYMLVYASAHALPNPWRSIIIWGMILGLSIVTPGVMFLSGRKQN